MMIPPNEMPPQITPQMIQAFMQAQQPQGMQQGQSPMQQMSPQGQPPTPPPGPQNMPPPSAAPQMNPNIMAFMQAMQQKQGGQPPQQGMPQQGGQPMSPQLQQMLMQRQKMMQQQQIEQQLAQQGRGGDKMIAHLTPGEMTVPPEVQTPKVLATLKKAYEHKGVHPAQFTAGSPASSVNPQTNLPEYNFMSSFLPAALGIGGALLAPMTGGASLGLSEAAMAGIGGGLGTTAGGLLSGKSPEQAALMGLGSGLGGYALSGLGGAASSAASKGAGVMPGAASQAASSAADATAGFPGYMNAAQQAPQVLGSQTLGNAVANFNPGQAAGSAIGGYFGNQIGKPPAGSQSMVPPGFNNHLTPVGQLPSFQNQLGYNTYNGPTANFSGYNPQTNNPGAFNFFNQPRT